MSLPAAWSDYIDSAGGASCLGPRSGLQAQHHQYHAALEKLADPAATTLALVSRPDAAALREAARASGELAAQGIRNQRLIINGVLVSPLAGDPVAEPLGERQAQALAALPVALRGLAATSVPLTARSLIGIDALRALSGGRIEPSRDSAPSNVDGPPLPGIDALIDELATSGHGAVLVMGKGGVGKTTIAAAIATGLAHRGHDVHLSTTDPAGRVAEVIADAGGGRLTMSRSGHTLRLLDLTGSYHRQIMRDAADIHGRITTPPMRLQDPSYSRVLVVTTPEVTPVSEAAALHDDLRRAGIEPFGWVVNASLTHSGTRDPVLRARARLERPQLDRVRDHLAQRTWLVPWQSQGGTDAKMLDSAATV